MSGILKDFSNTELVNIRRGEQDLQGGTTHLYPVNIAHPVRKFRQCDAILYLIMYPKIVILPT